MVTRREMLLFVVVFSYNLISGSGCCRRWFRWQRWQYEWLQVQKGQLRACASPAVRQTYLKYLRRRHSGQYSCNLWKQLSHALHANFAKLHLAARFNSSLDVCAFRLPFSALANTGGGGGGGYSGGVGGSGIVVVKCYNCWSLEWTSDLGILYCSKKEYLKLSLNCCIYIGLRLWAC